MTRRLPIVIALALLASPAHARRRPRRDPAAGFRCGAATARGTATSDWSVLSFGGLSGTPTPCGGRRFRTGLDLRHRVEPITSTLCLQGFAFHASMEGWCRLDMTA